MTPTKLETLGQALLIVANDLVSDDGIAQAAINEAGNRLLQMAVDLAIILPALPAPDVLCARWNQRDSRMIAMTHAKLASLLITA